QDRAAVPPLENLVGNAKAPASRLLALHVLHGLSALDPKTLASALRDANADVRAGAVRLCALTETNADLVAALADDTSARVRAEVGWAFVTLAPAKKTDAL